MDTVDFRSTSTHIPFSGQSAGFWESRVDEQPFSMDIPAFQQPVSPYLFPDFNEEMNNDASNSEGKPLFIIEFHLILRICGYFAIFPSPQKPWILTAESSCKSRGRLSGRDGGGVTTRFYRLSIYHYSIIIIYHYHR